MTESSFLTGKVYFKLYDKDQNLINEFSVNNLVVQTGLQHIASRMGDGSESAEMSFMALGTSNTPPILSHIALQSPEVDRVELDVPGGVLAQSSRTYVAVFGAGTTGEIQEAGIFNEDDVMLCRAVFPPINKGVGDSLVVTWVVTVG
jgi:hypothetical protein